MRVRRPTRSKNGSITALGALLLVIVGTAAHSYFQQESQLSARLAQTTGGGGKRSSTKQAAGGGGDRDGDTAAAAGAAPGSIPRLSRELAHERARDGVIVVTWANLAFSDFVLNWAAAVQRQGIDNYLVGAMDQETAEVGGDTRSRACSTHKPASACRARCASRFALRAPRSPPPWAPSLPPPPPPPRRSCWPPVGCTCLPCTTRGRAPLA